MRGNATVIDVKVKPKARQSRLLQADDGSWLAELNAAPVEGKANAELIALVAKHFRCAKAAVSIKSGASGRRKLVLIESGRADPEVAPGRPMARRR